MKAVSQRHCRHTQSSNTLYLTLDPLGIKAIALTSARGRCTLQSDSYFTLWGEKKQIMNMDWDAYVPWAGDESSGWSEFLPSCCLCSIFLDLSSTHGLCELVVNWFGWFFVLGSHFATFNSTELLFYSLRASVEVNSIVTARHTEGLIIQSSITLIFPSITITVIVVLLDKNLECQKKLTKYTNTLLLLQ